jgi:hypothetical protein
LAKDWFTFWATFSQTHLVTLFGGEIFANFRQKIWRFFQKPML